MSDTKSTPLTDEQREIFNSIPALHPPVMSIEDRFSLTNELGSLKSEVERLKVELKEAQAAAAVMRNLLREGSELLNEVAAYGNCECDIPIGKTCIPCECAMLYKSVASKLSSTTAGTTFLARMAEAEWLVGNVKGVFMDSGWAARRDAFLKGEEVKA